MGVQDKQRGNIPTFTPPGAAPTFTPPGAAPTFVPPGGGQAARGAVCFHHPNEPAAAQCARCGKYICKDCTEAYGVNSGKYAKKCLCYDCCQEIVSENVELLKKQKTSITFTFVLTIVGMLVGLSLFADTGSGIVTIIGMLWMGSFWTWLKNTISGWWNAPDGPSIAGFIGACLGAALVAPVITAKKLYHCITYLKSTSTAIEEDSRALAQMRDYMEYTLVRSQNKGVDLSSLMNEGSALYNNTYAQAIRDQGEEAADAMLRQATTRIAENGEIIRGFAA